LEHLELEKAGVRPLNFKPDDLLKPGEVKAANLDEAPPRRTKAIGRYKIYAVKYCKF
jgi:hypothetical protein